MHNQVGSIATSPFGYSQPTGPTSTAINPSNIQQSQATPFAPRAGVLAPQPAPQVNGQASSESESDESTGPKMPRRGGSHCPWSSDTVAFMRQLHKEACNLRVQVVKATSEAAAYRADSQRVREEYQRMMVENAELKKQIDRLEQTMTQIQGEQQRRLWNLERENSASARTLKTLSEKVVDVKLPKETGM